MAIIRFNGGWPVVLCAECNCIDVYIKDFLKSTGMTLREAIEFFSKEGRICDSCREKLKKP